MTKPLSDGNDGALAFQIKPIVPQEISKNQDPCPCCGCDRLNFVQMQPPSPHYACWRCGNCDCFRGWVAKPKNKVNRAEVQRAIAQLLESPSLSAWEREFLSSIKNQPKLSPRQREILSQIQVRVGGEG